MVSLPGLHDAPLTCRQPDQRGQTQAAARARRSARVVRVLRGHWGWGLGVGPGAAAVLGGDEGWFESGAVWSVEDELVVLSFDFEAAFVT